MPTALQPVTELVPPTVAPAPGPLKLVPFLVRFLRNPLGTLPKQVYEEPIVYFRWRGPGIAWVTDPALTERVLLGEHARFPKTPLEKRVLGPALGDGLLTAEGASWRWQRRTLAPLFRHQELVRFVPAMSDATDRQVADWRRTGTGTRRVAVDQAMTDLTYDIITRTILSGVGAAEGDAIKHAAHRQLSVVSWEIAAGLLAVPEHVWHPGKGRLKRGAATMRAVVSGIVARERRAPSTDVGLLAQLLAARDPDTGAPLSDSQITDNLVTFLVAGHETTAKALTWALYLLARAPEWQTAVREEAASLRATPQGAAPHLPITTRVLKEAMRLYPPAPFVSRRAAEPVTLGGVDIPAQTFVNIPIWAIHRHKRLWQSPDRFDPDRFLPEAEARLPRTQFMPFGFGPRTCIGNAFAMIEGTVVLAGLVRGARFETDGRHLPEPVSRVTLRPRHGMPLDVTPL